MDISHLMIRARCIRRFSTSEDESIVTMFELRQVFTKDGFDAVGQFLLFENDSASAENRVSAVSVHRIGRMGKRERAKEREK